MTGGPESTAYDAGPLLLGVRHHGPGSARAVRAALQAARPAVVLIEGPPEADPLIPPAADPGLRPPVALLAHAVDEPGRSAFWPFAEFSPEWVAIRWALEHDVPARFIDLPATHTLAWAEGAGKRGNPGPRLVGVRRTAASTRLVPVAVGPGPTMPGTSSVSIRSPCSPRRPGTTIRNAGGKTSWSTGGRAPTTPSRRSRRWGRP